MMARTKGNHWKTRATSRDRTITKKTPFGRIVRARSEDDDETFVYLHSTKGRRTRRATPHLFHAMGV